jgi:hypothetical protein
MTFCPNCGTATVAGQTACAACGRAVSAPGTRPTSVVIATGILALTMAFSSFGLAVTFVRMGVARMMAYPMLWISPLLLALLVVAVVSIWTRHGWGRILLLLILAWSFSALVSTLLKVGLVAGPTPLLLLALRLVAVWLLFRKESNEWFGSRIGGAGAAV